MRSSRQTAMHFQDNTVKEGIRTHTRRRKCLFFTPFTHINSCKNTYTVDFWTMQFVHIILLYNTLHLGGQANRTGLCIIQYSSPKPQTTSFKMTIKLNQHTSTQFQQKLIITIHERRIYCITVVSDCISKSQVYLIQLYIQFYYNFFFIAVCLDDCFFKWACGPMAIF